MFYYDEFSDFTEKEFLAISRRLQRSGPLTGMATISTPSLPRESARHFEEYIMQKVDARRPTEATPRRRPQQLLLEHKP